MAMEINSVNRNYANIYSNSKETKQTKDTKSSGETTRASEARRSESTAQTTNDYLNNLRKKYSDANITVVDFKSEKQELSYMIGSSGGNNVAISSSIVAKMAKDPATAAKYEKVIADIPNHGKEVKEKIESEPGCKVYASGVQIDKDGKVTYWIVGGKSGEGPGTKEKMQKMLEEKRAEKKKQEKAEASRKEKLKEQEKLEEKMAERRTEEKERMELLLAKGETVENTISAFYNDNMRNVSGDNLYSAESGSRVDFSV